MIPKLVTRYSLIDEILDVHRGICGTNQAGYAGYRNHAYRVFNFARLPSKQETDRDDKIATAAAFHNLAVFRSLDYIEPSLRKMRAYLEKTGRQAWSSEISQMIEMHHKLRSYQSEHAALVEPFRKADWIDVLFGTVRFAIPREFIREDQDAFPISSFYPGTIFQIVGRWIIRHPLRPLPVLRW